MKRLFLSFLLLIGAAGTALGGDGEIENHGFGVFTAEGEGGRTSRTVLFLHNEDCIGSYKVANGEVILGEGKIDFRQVPTFDIPFGTKELQVSCSGGDKLRVTFR